ncbi:MAG: LacI family DNA-binding transcriptional regulator [Spirochaetia bacterium]|nr:LacI family DNA-binding transcriptional regulator [Spirochaetia bacterium]
MSETVNYNIRRVTLREIAKKGKVSLSTASKVLSGSHAGFISDETKRRIQKIARDLRYLPNFGQRLLAGKKTNIVGLVIGNERVSREEHIQRLIVELAFAFKEKKQLLYTNLLSEDRPVEDILELINMGCEAFVIIGTPSGFEEVERAILENGKTYINVTGLFPRQIRSDVPWAFAEFAGHFKKIGAWPFRLLEHPATVGQVQSLRVAGLLRAFPGEPPQKVIDQYLCPISPKADDRESFFQAGYEATGELILKNPEVKGFLYHNDDVALGGMRLLHEKGFAIGKDVHVAGYNDGTAARFGTVPFSSAGLDYELVAETIVREVFRSEPVDLWIKPKMAFR